MLKNITLSVDEETIQRARRLAALENTTLNELFRAWIKRYITRASAVNQYEELMRRLTYVEPGKKFTREEMNERE